MKCKKINTQAQPGQDALEIVRFFLTYKKAAGLSYRTLLDYDSILHHFFKLDPGGMDTPRQSCQGLPIQLKLSRISSRYHSCIALMRVQHYEPSYALWLTRLKKINCES